MTILDAGTGTWRVDEPAEEIEIVRGLLATAVFGTNAGLSGPRRYRTASLTVLAATEPQEVDPADEVRQRRDDISQRGLTRQDVARGIGVDRRSLSGYASGEIRPQPERLEALRILDRVTREIEAEHPGRVRDVVVARRGALTVLDAIGRGRYEIALAWRTFAAGLDAHVDVRPRTRDEGEPIWSAALHALAEGRLAAPPRSTTVRDPDTYEMDLAEAAPFEEADTERRRRPGYR